MICSNEQFMQNVYKFFLLIYKNFYFWDCFSPKKFEPHQHVESKKCLAPNETDETIFTWKHIFLDTTKIYSVDSSCTYTIFVFLKILFHFCISWEREKKKTNQNLSVCYYSRIMVNLALKIISCIFSGWSNGTLLHAKRHN